MSRVYDFITTHMGQIGLVVLFIVVMWLKSIFVTIDKYETDKTVFEDEIELLEKEVQSLKTQVATLEHLIIDFENGLVDVKSRQEKKVKIQNDLKKEVNEIENEQIRILKDIEYLKSD